MKVRDLGCQSFALLFDDIEDELCNEDVTKFASIADAQCFLTNEIYNHLNQPDLFLFCPTGDRLLMVVVVMMMMMVMVVVMTVVVNKWMR